MLPARNEESSKRFPTSLLDARASPKPRSSTRWPWLQPKDVRMFRCTPASRKYRRHYKGDGASGRELFPARQLLPEFQAAQRVPLLPQDCTRRDLRRAAAYRLETGELFPDV